KLRSPSRWRRAEQCNAREYRRIAEYELWSDFVHSYFSATNSGGVAVHVLTDLGALANKNAQQANSLLRVFVFSSRPVIMPANFQLKSHRRTGGSRNGN